MRILWVRVTRAISGLANLYRLKSGFMMALAALFCIACALFTSACAHHDDDASADSGQHRGHHRGGYGHGQGGAVNQTSNEVISGQ